MCRIPLGEPKTPAVISQVHRTGSLEAQRCRAWFPKYALLYPLPSATSGRRFAIGSSKPTSTTSSSLGPLRSLRGSRAPSCDFASQSSSRCSSGNLTTLSQVLLALRQPDAFGAGEYHNPSAPTTRNSPHPSSDIASQCSLRSPQPNPTSPSQPKKPR